MPRSISSPTATALAAGVSRPAYLVEIVWSTFSTRLCTYGTVTWAGSSWVGGGVNVGGFNEDGIPSELTLADPDAAYRTLIATDGARDRRVNVWKADMSALAAGDPIPIFAGYADGAVAERGRVIMGLDLRSADREFCPRERIGPAIGINYVAPPGTRIQWGNSILVLNAR